MKKTLVKLWHHPIISKEHPLHPWIILLGAVISTDMTMIAAVGEALTSPYTQGYFAIGVTHLAWIGTIFLLALGASVPICMRLAVQLGYKRMFFIGNVIFYIGSLFVGLSHTYTLILLSRVIAGLGAGIILPLCIAFIANAFPKEKLALALSCYTAFGFGFGYVCGSLIGGIFAQHFPWQYLYYFTFAIGIVALITIFIFYEETPARSVGKFDIIGYLTFIGFVASCMIFTMNVKAPWNTLGWYSNFTYIMYAIMTISLAIFIFYELRRKQPLFILRHFKIRAFTLSCIAIFLIGCLLFGSAIVLPDMLHNDLNWPMGKIGIYLAPYGISIGIAGAIVGLFATQIGIRIPTIIGLVLVGISCLMQHSFTLYSSHKDLIWLLIVRGAGIGMSLGPITALGLSKVQKDQIPKATVMVTIFRQTGAAFGANILNIIVAERFPFHSLRFGTMMNKQSTMYQKVEQDILTYNETLVAENAILAKEKTTSYINEFVIRQAHVVAVNDAFFVVGIAILFISAILGFFMLYAYVQRKGYINKLKTS